MDIVMKKKKGISPELIIVAMVTAVAVGIGVFTGLGRHAVPVTHPTQENINPITETTNTKQPPTSIFIPKLNKRLPVQASVVKGNTWDLFNTSVAWLSTSAVPGEGNVILYAHDWPNLWGDLYKLQPGDAVEVDQNTTVHIYVVTQSRAVNPEDVQAILSKENQVTMFTCEGTFDQKRRVVVALPQ
jgi:LPXTG-site transpeptidase (sortase) family protein